VPRGCHNALCRPHRCLLVYDLGAISSFDTVFWCIVSCQQARTPCIACFRLSGLETFTLHWCKPTLIPLSWDNIHTELFTLTKLGVRWCSVPRSSVPDHLTYYQEDAQPFLHCSLGESNKSTGLFLDTLTVWVSTVSPETAFPR